MKTSKRKSSVICRRYKDPYDNLLYAVLLQAAYDKKHQPSDCTCKEVYTANEFFNDGTAKAFYNYLKGCEQ